MADILLKLGNNSFVSSGNMFGEFGKERKKTEVDRRLNFHFSFFKKIESFYCIFREIITFKVKTSLRWETRLKVPFRFI